ncbi:MAG: DUF924 family protein [Myxococcota bacterium]
MPHAKEAAIDYEIEPSLRRRFSPRAFSERALSPWTLRQILEAARWSPSCFNEQPWSFLVGHRSEPDAFEAVLACINDKNSAWAKDAGALLIACASTRFEKNEKPNRHGGYDCGQAVAMMSVQATQLGVGVHQMAGFDPEEARRRFSLPGHVNPMAAVALGYFGEPDSLPTALANRERAPRSRHPQEAFVFCGQHGSPWEPAGEGPATALLQTWFGDRDPNGWSSAAIRERWYTKDPEFDAQLRQGWSELHARALGGGCREWCASIEGRLAYVVLLDQLGRNIFRDHPMAFAGDAKALDAALDAIDAGLDHLLTGHHRCTLYMPLMHSERLEIQEQCVVLFEALAHVLPESEKEYALMHHGYAVQHRDIIRRFGRFPHRNAILGRESTKEELDFLETPGSSF